MSRREGSILIALETSPELEAVRILDVDERSLSSGKHFYSTTKNVSEQNRLEAVQSQRLYSSLAVYSANYIDTCRGNERAGIAQQSKAGRRSPEEPILLSPRILEPAGDFEVDRRDQYGSEGKCAEQDGILPGQ